LCIAQPTEAERGQLTEAAGAQPTKAEEGSVSRGREGAPPPKVYLYIYLSIYIYIYIYMSWIAQPTKAKGGQPTEAEGVPSTEVEKMFPMSYITAGAGARARDITRVGGGDPTEDPPPEGRATQGTHTEHTQMISIYRRI